MTLRIGLHHAIAVCRPALGQEAQSPTSTQHVRYAGPRGGDAE